MKIKYAKLHATTYAPGVGNISVTLDKTQFKILEMNYSDSVLTVKAAKDEVRTAPVTFLIPLPAIAIMVPDESK